MVDRSEVVKIKCGHIFLLSDDNIALICEFCERDFYKIIDFRVHLKEHLLGSQSNSKNKEDDFESISTATDCLVLTESTESADFKTDQNQICNLQSTIGNDNESAQSIQLPIIMNETNQTGSAGILSGELNNIEAYPHSIHDIPDNRSALQIGFECSFCGKLFNNKTNRDEHELHTGKRQYVCHICFKTHDACSNLSTHLWNVHKLRKQQ